MTRPEQPRDYPGDTPRQTQRDVAPQSGSPETRPEQPKPYPGDEPSDPSYRAAPRATRGDSNVHVYPRIFRVRR